MRSAEPAHIPVACQMERGPFQVLDDSCLRSYKRAVEFFHCGANRHGPTVGVGLQA